MLKKIIKFSSETLYAFNNVIKNERKINKMCWELEVEWNIHATPLNYDKEKKQIQIFMNFK